jgi:hypothetical protein
MKSNNAFDIRSTSIQDSPMGDLHQLPVRLDDATYQQLKLVAESRQRPMSKMIQQAVTELLERESRQLTEELSPRVAKLREYASRANGRAVALAAVVQGEAKHAKSDPVEGTRIETREKTAE